MSYSPSEAARAYVHDLGIAGPKSWAWMVTYDAGYDAGRGEADKNQADRIIELERAYDALKGAANKVTKSYYSITEPRLSRDPSGGWSKW